jgi:hypothetical protein
MLFSEDEGNHPNFRIFMLEVEIFAQIHHMEKRTVCILNRRENSTIQFLLKHS